MHTTAAPGPFTLQVSLVFVLTTHYRECLGPRGSALTTTSGRQVPPWHLLACDKSAFDLVQPLAFWFGIWDAVLPTTSARSNLGFASLSSLFTFYATSPVDSSEGVEVAYIVISRLHGVCELDGYGITEHGLRASSPTRTVMFQQWILVGGPVSFHDRPQECVTSCVEDLGLTQ